MFSLMRSCWALPHGHLSKSCLSRWSSLPLWKYEASGRAFSGRMIDPMSTALLGCGLKLTTHPKAFLQYDAPCLSPFGMSMKMNPKVSLQCIEVEMSIQSRFWSPKSVMNEYAGTLFGSSVNPAMKGTPWGSKILPFLFHMPLGGTINSWYCLISATNLY